MVNQKKLFEDKIMRESKLSKEQISLVLKERERSIIEEMKRKYIKEKTPWKPT